MESASELVGRAQVPAASWRGHASTKPSEDHQLVGRGGLEPPTSRLSGVRSNHLSYRPGRWAGPYGGASRAVPAR